MMDPIVEEVRAAREAYGRRFGFDLQAICRDLSEQEQAAGRTPIMLPPRRLDASRSTVSGIPSEAG